MPVTLSPLAGAGQQFFDNNGNPLSGGKLWSYQAGTTTPQTTYTTNAGNVAHTNPIILDSAGRIPSGGEIWLTVGQSYKFVLTTSADVVIATWDHIVGINDGGFSDYTPAVTSLLAPGPLTTKSALDQITDASNGSSVVGFLQSQTGSVATTVRSKLRETVSVFDFMTAAQIADVRANTALLDLTTTIQIALNTGKSLFFPEGSYLITAGLLFTVDYQAVFGVGYKSRIICNTGSSNNGVNMIVGTSRVGCVVEKLYFQNSGYGRIVPPPGVFTGMGCGVIFMNCTGCAVRDSWFYKCGGPGQGVAAIYFSSSQQCTASGNTITESLNGVNSDNWYYNVNSAARSRDNTIINNTIFSTYGFGIVVDIFDTNAFGQEIGDSIVGNVLYNNRYGISVLGQKVTVVGNTIDMNNYSLSGTGWDGIMITGADITVSGNTISNAYRNGVMIYANNLAGTGVPGYPVGGLAARNISVSNNIIKWDAGIPSGDINGSCGVKVVNGSSTNAASRIAIEGNIISAARNNGVFIDGSAATVNNVRVIGNTINACLDSGIEVDGVYDSGLLIDSNSSSGNTNCGIEVTSSPKARITNNSVVNNTTHGIYLSGSTRTAIALNAAQDNGSSTANTYDGIHITGLSTSSVVFGNCSGNFTSSNQRYGINIDDLNGGGCNVIGNQYTSNATANFNEVFNFGNSRYLETEPGSKVSRRSAAPTTGQWVRGDIVYSTTPTAGGFIGWVCVTSGTPGTWKQFGDIQP